ncbi:nuclear transport factor 2 family protein [Aquihabitans sp. G128]|uniref:nuclear transport factor 2 family protein n=1 Tax=Aquihabitans sp. G128 TaxID=2849779 RepID=UPI001C21E1EA|nr:nuclear transport factor 2 family protein [Aquihabitans sp. G128]QXC61913.1 nuclear transport factor 2 family protein [Aquihabitans sp. G128]
MPAYPRAELEEMVQRWLQANRDVEVAGDWAPLADLYTEDATYGWNYGPKENFMAVGRDEIRDIALGLEMGGLGGWEYPYQEVIIDEVQGHVIGFWRQVADAVREDGTHYEVAGIGGSWFRYGGNFQWSWQRDWFDYGNAAAVFLEMITDGKLSEGMTERMNRSLKPGQLPGHYLLADTPVGLWDGPAS